MSVGRWLMLCASTVIDGSLFLALACPPCPQCGSFSLHCTSSLVPLDGALPVAHHLVGSGRSCHVYGFARASGCLVDSALLSCWWFIAPGRVWLAGEGSRIALRYQVKCAREMSDSYLVRGLADTAMDAHGVIEVF